MNILAAWLEELAKKIESGKRINPCPKALRRTAAQLPATDDKPVGTLICESCGRPCNSTANGQCIDCHEPALEAWRAQMAIRQDPAQFDLRKLVNLLLSQHWMHHCKIIPAYMPPFFRIPRRGRVAWSNSHTLTAPQRTSGIRRDLTKGTAGTSTATITNRRSWR